MIHQDLIIPDEAMDDRQMTVILLASTASSLHFESSAKLSSTQLRDGEKVGHGVTTAGGGDAVDLPLTDPVDVTQTGP